jgi:hypothetical protein
MYVIVRMRIPSISRILCGSKGCRPHNKMNKITPMDEKGEKENKLTINLIFIIIVIIIIINIIIIIIIIITIIIIIIIIMNIIIIKIKIIVIINRAYIIIPTANTSDALETHPVRMYSGLM